MCDECLKQLKRDEAVVASMVAQVVRHPHPDVPLTKREELDFSALALLLTTVVATEGGLDEPETLGWEPVSPESVADFKQHVLPAQAVRAGQLARRLSIIFDAIAGWVEQRLVSGPSPEEVRAIVDIIKQAVEKAGLGVSGVEVMTAEQVMADPKVVVPHNGGRGPKPPVS